MLWPAPAGGEYRREEHCHRLAVDMNRRIPPDIAKSVFWVRGTDAARVTSGGVRRSDNQANCRSRGGLRTNIYTVVDALELGAVIADKGSDVDTPVETLEP